jgi:hypothetical protein
MKQTISYADPLSVMRDEAGTEFAAYLWGTIVGSPYVPYISQLLLRCRILAFLYVTRASAWKGGIYSATHSPHLASDSMIMQHPIPHSQCLLQ